MALNLPDFFTDPLFTGSQEKLYGEGMGILEGDIPELLQPSLQTGHPESLKMLNQITGDISKNVLESRARSGRVADPSTAEIIGKQTARASTEFNWKDLLRSLDAQQKAYQTGTGLVGDVGTKALDYSGTRSNYQLKQAQLEAQAEASEGSPWGDILGLAGTAAGMFFGQPALGAMAGKALGSAVSGSSGGGGGGYGNLDLFEGDDYVNAGDLDFGTSGKFVY